MNYGQHALIGIGTAGLGLWVAQAAGLPRPETGTMLAGAAIVALGSIAVDIDHPRAFISRGLPLELLERALPLLALPVVFIAAAMISDDVGALKSLRSWLEISFVRWALIVAGLALALMVTSWIIAGTLKHRGPLHSLVFSVAMTIVAIAIAVYLDHEWWWGLGFGWGWLLHILADGMTEWGVPLWWPYSSERAYVPPYPGFEYAGSALFILAILSILGTLLGHGYGFIA